MNIKSSPTPRISVIIPIYNAERFLRQCLDSVIDQPMRDIEIICVNDGSTDGSGVILDEYAKKDPRIQVIHQDNKGNGIARNVGIDVASGEYIHFLDSDDFLADEVYEDIYKIARDFELDYLYLKAYTIDAFSGEPIDGYDAERFSLHLMESQDYEMPFSIIDRPEPTINLMRPVWGGLHRREFLNQHNIRFPALRSSPDQFFYFAEVSHAVRIMAADIYAVYYRKNNPSSIVGTYGTNPENYIKAYKMIKSYCQFLPKHIHMMILRYHVNVILYYSFNALSSNLNDSSMVNIVRSFVNNLNLSEVVNNPIPEPWYRDYLILKCEIGRLDGTLSLSDEKQLLAELNKTMRTTIPLPFDRIHQNSKIILYGAGFFGIRTYKFMKLSQCCEVVLWVDKDWESYSRINLPVFSPDEITDHKFDNIFLAIEKPIIATEVKDYLAGIGISGDKVISNANKMQSECAKAI